MYTITVFLGWDSYLRHSGSLEEVTEFENGVRRDFLPSQIVAVTIRKIK